MCWVDKKILPSLEDSLQPDSLLKLGLPDIIKIHHQIVVVVIGSQVCIIKKMLDFSLLLQCLRLLLETLQLPVPFLHMMSLAAFLVLVLV